VYNKLLHVEIKKNYTFVYCHLKIYF